MNSRPYPYRHVVATLYGCGSDILDDQMLLSTTLKAIRNANMKLAKTKTQNPLVYKINTGIMGDGASVSALITTSHLTIHASKLHRAIEFDCATCGHESNPRAALETFKKALRPTRIITRFQQGAIQKRILTLPTKA